MNNMNGVKSKSLMYTLIHSDCKNTAENKNIRLFLIFLCFNFYFSLTLQSENRSMITPFSFISYFQ